MLLNMYGVKYLVGGLEHVLFFHILGRSSQLLLTHIFQRGRSTTKQNKLWDNNIYTEFHAEISFRHFSNKIKESNRASYCIFVAIFHSGRVVNGSEPLKVCAKLQEIPLRSASSRPAGLVRAKNRNVCNENGHQITARWCPIVS